MTIDIAGIFLAGFFKGLGMLGSAIIASPWTLLSVIGLVLLTLLVKIIGPSLRRARSRSSYRR